MKEKGLMLSGESERTSEGTRELEPNEIKAVLHIRMTRCLDIRKK